MADHSRNTPTQDRPVNQAGAADFPEIQGGRYRFIEVIGSGGAGTVYRAHDAIMDRHVAVKKLHNTANEMIAVRFQREARLAGALRHKHVLSAIDFGLTAKNEPYLILDYVEGESLSQLVRRVGPLPVRDALRIFIQLAKGMAHAHKNNIIHRDLKPSNAMLVSEEDPYTGKKQLIAKVVDFGLAKALDDDQYLTKTNVAVGTPAYMSPEQLRGIEVDRRSDIYSFGCLMFQLLAGCPPFDGDNALNVAALHISLEAPTLESHDVECSEDMDRIVDTCLQKDPDKRFQTFDELLVELQNEFDATSEQVIEEQQDSLEDPQDETKILKPDKPKNWMRLIGICMLLLVLLAVLGFYWWMQIPTELAESSSSKESKKREDIDLIGFGGFNVDGAEKQYGRRIMHESTDETILKLTKADGVQHIDISNSRLTPKAYEHLNRLGTVRSLIATDTPVDSEFVANICRIKSLDTVLLGDTSNFDFTALKLFNSNPKVYDFGIQQMQLTRSATEELSKVEHVGTLSLTLCTGVTRDTLKPLFKLNHLKVLKLDSSDVDDGALRDFKSFQHLRNLTLAGTKITDKGLKNLYGIKELGSLNVERCRGITQAGLTKFRSHFPGLKLYTGVESKRVLDIESDDD